MVDLEALGERQITLDCDVIQADGGTRTAAISGAWVALRLAVDGLLAKKLIEADPIRQKVAAVSCGIHGGQAVLDLDYAEDSAAGCGRQFRADRRRQAGRSADHARKAKCFDEEGLLRAAPPRPDRLRGDFRGAGQGDRPVTDKLEAGTAGHRQPQ